MIKEIPAIAYEKSVYYIDMIGSGANPELIIRHTDSFGIHIVPNEHNEKVDDIYLVDLERDKTLVPIHLVSNNPKIAYSNYLKYLNEQYQCELDRHRAIES